MDSKLMQAVAYCQEQVDNQSIYVWGAEGQLGASVTAAWIRRQEAACNSKYDSDGRLFADIAVAMYEARRFHGNTTFRCFDCSGLVSAALMHAGLLDKRTDCDGLWAKCSRLATPIDGCLLFRVNSANSEDETHVGLYFGGYAYHAKGRSTGVVKEEYKASYWHKCGWLKIVSTEQTVPAVTPVPSAVSSEADDFTPPYVLALNDVNIRSGPGTKYPKLSPNAILYKGQIAQYEETDADTGWYGVSTRYGLGFVSPRADLTKLVL